MINTQKQIQFLEKRADQAQKKLRQAKKTLRVQERNELESRRNSYVEQIRQCSLRVLYDKGELKIFYLPEKDAFFNFFADEFNGETKKIPIGKLKLGQLESMSRIAIRNQGRV